MKRVVATILLALASSHLFAADRKVTFEDFNLPKPGIGESIFSARYVWQGSTYLTHELEDWTHAPNFSDAMPINKGGDREAWFATEYISGGSGFALLPDVESNYVRNVVVDGYVGVGMINLNTQTPGGGGFALRHTGSPFHANAYSAQVCERTDGTAYLRIDRWTNGAVRTSSLFISESFPAIGTNGCYHLRFGSLGGALIASVSHVLPAGFVTMETPLDLQSAVGIQPFVMVLHDQYPVGRVGLVSSANRGNCIYYDDITIISDPVADLSIKTRIKDLGKHDQRQEIRISVKNKGPDEAVGVMITDILPAPLTLVASTPPVVLTAQGYQYALPTLASGAVQIVTMIVTAPDAFKGTVTNRASVTSLVVDPLLRDNAKEKRIKFKSVKPPKK